MRLWCKVAIGLVLGVIVGIFFPAYAVKMKPFGDIFLRLIKMIMAPLIFFALLSGITSVQDPSSLGRIGIKSVLSYFCTTFFAVIFGLLIAILFRPGAGTHIDISNYNLENGQFAKFDIVTFLVDIIPSNALGAFVDNNILQIVFLSVFVGIVINSMGVVAEPIRRSLSIFSKLTLRMIGKIVEFSPYAAFALTAAVIGEQGIKIIVSLSNLVFSIVVAMGLQYAIFGVMIWVFCRLSPIPFYKKSVEYQLIALSTGSSKAALATTMQICNKKLGVSDVSTSFVLPIGASINMDGFAINLSLTTIFFAQALGIELHVIDYVMIVLTSTLGSIGGAGIPGASLIMLPMVLSSVNIPTECIGMIVGIDRILDLLRTAINITGDATITLIVDNSEGTLDRKVYYS